MTNKRSRGRPKGTTINDVKYLDAVAALMVKQPELKKTPAISQIVQKYFPEHRWEAVERRLLRKWNETGEERLEEARLQSAEEGITKLKELTSASNPSFPTLGSAYHVMEQAQRIGKMMEEIANPPALRAFAEQQKRMRDIMDPPALRSFREQTQAIENAMRPLKLDFRFM